MKPLSTTEEFLDAALNWRCITPGEQCQNCGGAGKLAYGSTATWRRSGIGGAAITVDVCNSCWGSGDRHRPWPSHDRARTITNDPKASDPLTWARQILQAILDADERGQGVQFSEAMNLARFFLMAKFDQ